VLRKSIFIEKKRKKEEMRRLGKRIPEPKDPNILLDKKLRRLIIDHVLRQKRLMHAELSTGIRIEVEKDAFTLKDVRKMMANAMDEEHIVRVMYKNRKYWPPMLILTDNRLGLSWKNIITLAVACDMTNKFPGNRFYEDLEQLLPCCKEDNFHIAQFFDSKIYNNTSSSQSIFLN